MIKVLPLALTAALFGTATAADCYAKYSSGATYSSGDIVSISKSEEESCTRGSDGCSCPSGSTSNVGCKKTVTNHYNHKCHGSWSAFCSQYAPETQGGSQAWSQQGGACDVTDPPAQPPVPAGWSPEHTGCPPKHESSGAGHYAAGDVVSIDTNYDYSMVYQCVSSEYSAHCGSEAYAPKTSQYWHLAWKELGSCLAETQVPVLFVDPDTSSTGLCRDGADNGYDIIGTDTTTVDTVGTPDGCFAWCMSLPDISRTMVGFQLYAPSSGIAECSCLYADPTGSSGEPDFITNYNSANGNNAFYTDYNAAGGPSWGSGGMGPVAKTVSGNSWVDFYCYVFETQNPKVDTSAASSLEDVGGCPSEWEEGTDYAEGDRVSKCSSAGSCVSYKCKNDPYSGWCPLAGYEPGEGSAWKQAWDLEGSCSGTISPTSSPSFVALEDYGGCPAAWEQKTVGDSYEEGDLVSAGGLVFKCKAWPYSHQCGQDGYEPNTEPAAPGAWSDAWTTVGYCEGTIGPTDSPTFDPANSVGDCPEEWEAGSHTKYEGGDLVTVEPDSDAYTCREVEIDPDYGNQSNNGGRLLDQPGFYLVGAPTAIAPICPGETFACQTADTATGESCHPEVTAYCAALIPDPDSPVAFNTLDFPAGTAAACQKIVYKCKSGAMSGHCGQYSPTDELGGSLGWTYAGHCEDDDSPTASPSFTKLANVGPCPEEYSPGADYEAEDQVAVTVSEDPVRKVLYECRKYPNSGFCSQSSYAPGEENGGMAWTLKGYCDGTFSPTASPEAYTNVFTAAAPGVPESWSCQYTKCTPTPTPVPCTYSQWSNTCPKSSCSCTTDSDNVETCTGCTVEKDVDVCANAPVDNYLTIPLSDLDSGDVVRVGTQRYKCRGWPNGLWCKIGGDSYAPGTGMHWTDAWIKDGTCA